MVGMFLSAFILLVVIKMLAGEDVDFGNAFFAAAVSGIVGQILVSLAVAPMTSQILAIIVASIILFVVTGIAVQLICSTDLRHVLMISGVYTAVKVVLQIVATLFLSVD